LMRMRSETVMKTPCVFLILRSGASRVSKDTETGGPHGSRRRKSASSP
jgi:hypothetical protein